MLGILTAAVVVISMVVMRDILRNAYLQPFRDPAGPTVQTQWEVLPIFLAVFVAGVALWGFMMWRYHRSLPEEPRPKLEALEMPGGQR